MGETPPGEPGGMGGYAMKTMLPRFGRGLMTCALALATATPLMAEDLTMWVRESAADPGTLMVNLWNSTHDNKITLTAIPDNQLVTKLATSSQTGDAPDLVSFDLIYMPDFMKAGLLTDLTEQLAADTNYATHIQAYKDIATYEGKTFGVGFTPDVSVLAWNKDLFRQAGLDPEKPPQTIAEIHEMATKIRAIGPDTYGFYFSGSCPGCNIFVTSPLMVAGGAKILPKDANDTALDGEAIKVVLETYKAMWEEGLVPESAEVDTGANFVSAFVGGNIGIAGTGGFLISLMEREHPEFDYGLTLLPGLEPGQVSGFVGGDVVAIPANGKNEAAAREFVTWVLSDEAQLEGLAKNSILTTRTDLADNEYAQNPKVQVTAQALAAGYVPWVFHFADMVNSDSSPWITMLQTAIFDGDVDGAIETARAEMMAIVQR
jgi:multiple sugar transport system substrate-binding protein